MELTKVIKGNQYEITVEIGMGGRYKAKVGDLIEIIEDWDSIVQYKNLRNRKISNIRKEFLADKIIAYARF